MNRLALACVSIVCMGACEAEQPPSAAEESFPTLALAIGSEILEIPFMTERCTDEGEVRRVELLAAGEVADAQGALYTPHVLVARLKDMEVMEAHAFATNASFAGHHYPLIHAAAKALPDHPPPACRVEVTDGVITIACNNAIIVPWLAKGPRPQPSFKVSFRCD